MTAVQPNFTTPVTIQPDKLNNFCRRFELAKIKLSELEPIVQKTEETHTLAGVRVGIDAFHVSPRFLRSLMSLFDFTEKPSNTLRRMNSLNGSSNGMKTNPCRSALIRKKRPSLP